MGHHHRGTMVRDSPVDLLPRVVVTTPSLQRFRSRVVSGGDCVPSILPLVRHWRLGGGSAARRSMCSDTHNWHITEKSSNRRRCWW